MKLQLKLSYSKKIAFITDPLRIDNFTLNKSKRKFVSPSWIARCWENDGVSFPWTNILGIYAFPPISLKKMIVCKFSADKTEGLGENGLLSHLVILLGQGMEFLFSGKFDAEILLFILSQNIKV